MASFGFSGLRARSVLFVLLAVVPASGLILWTALEQRESAAVRVQKDLLRLAELIALDEEQLINETCQLLATLGEAPEVQIGEASKLQPFFADLLKRWPCYANLGMIKPNGDVLVTALPSSGTINLSDRSYFQKALRTRRFSTSGYMVGRISHQPTLNVGYPVVDDQGQVQAVLYAALDLVWLSRLDAKVEAQLPKGSTLTTLDSSGTILGHAPDPEKWIGRRVAVRPLARTVLARREGTRELPGFDGVRRFHAFTPVHSESVDEDLFVVVGTPREVAFADADRILAHSLSWGGLVALIALLAGWFGADMFIVRPTKALLRTTEQLAGGDLSVRTGQPAGRGELARLARSFDQMAEALEQRDAARQKAEEQLRASEGELRALIAAMTDLIMVFDGEGRYLQIQPTNPALLYRPPEELIGKRLHEVFLKDQADFFLGAIRRAIETQRPVTLEYGLPIGGVPMWFSGSVSPMLEDKAVAVIRNITERKQAEETLRKSEQEKALLLDSISEYVVHHDTTLRTLWLNRAAAETANRPSDQVVGRHCFEVWHERNEPCQNCPIVETLRTGEPRQAEMTFPDGRSLFMRGYPVRDAQGAVTGVVEVTLDITARRRAQEALRSREEYFRALIENISDIVIVLNADDTIRYASPSVERVLGYKPEELVGKNYNDYLHPDDATSLTGVMADAVRSVADTPLVEFQVRHKDGTWRLLEGVGRSLFHNPAVDGFVANARDVTDRKTLEGQLRQSQRIQAVGKLAGGVAHDFNNLLTAIMGYSDLLLSRAGEDSPFRKEILEIRKAGERATMLTRQLLAFSRRQVLQPRVMDLNATVADLHTMLCRLIGEDIDLVTVLMPALGRVKADPGQIEQVIINLAVNARDAMPNGGKLTLETANVILDEAYARQHVSIEPGDYVLLAVSDTGCGMDEETQTHLFEPFFTTKERGKGTGLGLSTVYGIVKQSGGHIWVYSEMGRGTTVKVYLPRVEEALVRTDSTAARAGPTTGTETVLVVEDEEEVRGLVCEILRTNGYTVLEAAATSQALELCRRHKDALHLMITDVVMPAMSGRELAEQVATFSPTTKVLYMSGYTENAIVHHGVLDEGMNFLQKPFAPDVLARKVRDILDAPCTWPNKG